MDDQRISVLRGSSKSLDAQVAVAEVKAQIAQPDAAVVIFFCSSRYDLEALGREINAAFDCPVIGCTTAGELSSAGLQEGSLVAVSVVSPELRVHAELIQPLKTFKEDEAYAVAQRIKGKLELVGENDISRMFGFLLIDGLSMLEEQVLSELYWQFNGVSFVGGSAGDDLKFEVTNVFGDGRFATDAAIFALFETTLPFKVFKTQHFDPNGEKLVITSSDPATRTVFEINGLPAKDEYARALGLQPDELKPEHYSCHPLMLIVGNDRFVRSVSKINDDGSLSFFAAIEDGLVLTMGDAVDMVDSLKAQFKVLREEVPEIRLVIGCDCILRRLEIIDKGLQDDIRDVLSEVNFIGFSTYGEQFNATHVNQTLTGIAIGDDRC